MGNSLFISYLSSMAIQQVIGKRGEILAAEYLEHKGYQIVAINWRFKKAEVDIIAKAGAVLIFFEVKTRSYDYFGPPDAAINAKKEGLITSAAHAYLAEHQYEGEIRFDVISILLKENAMAEIAHIEDAFFWGI